MASKQNADKPQRKRTQRFNHPFASLLPNGHPRSRPSGLLAIYALSRYVLRSLEDTEQRVVKKNHVGSSCRQYLPIRLMYKSEGREHGQQSPALMCDIVGHASRRGRVGATEDSTRPLLRKEPRSTPKHAPTISLTCAN